LAWGSGRGRRLGGFERGGRPARLTEGQPVIGSIRWGRRPGKGSWPLEAICPTHLTLLEAQVLIGDWHTEYNTYRPHAALGMLTPAEFADQWRPTNPPNLS
jgi:transposase InsO family protein